MLYQYNLIPADMWCVNPVTCRTFAAGTRVREDGEMTLIRPTHLTADGIGVGMRSELTLNPCQLHPLNSQGIFKPFYI